MKTMQKTTTTPAFLPAQLERRANECVSDVLRDNRDVASLSPRREIASKGKAGIVVMLWPQLSSSNYAGVVGGKRDMDIHALEVI